MTISNNIQRMSMQRNLGTVCLEVKKICLPFKMVATRLGYHPRWRPQGLVTIQDGGHKAWLPFKMVVTRLGYHSRWWPQGLVTIQDGGHEAWLPSKMAATKFDITNKPRGKN